MKKKTKRREVKVTFLCMQKCVITLVFFLLMELKKKIGAVEMKVNNMHEFVKKINNAAFVG